MKGDLVKCPVDAKRRNIKKTIMQSHYKKYCFPRKLAFENRETAEGTSAIFRTYSNKRRQRKIN